MRIVYFLTSLGIGGAERQTIVLGERMALRGHDIAVLVLRSQTAEEWPTSLPVTYLNVRNTPGSLLAGFARAKESLRRLHPDLLHSHTYPANMAARLLRPMNGACAVVSTVHNVYEGATLRMLAYRITDPLSDRTVMVCKAAMDRYIRMKAVPRRKCTSCTNGIEIAEFVPESQRRSRMRSELSAAADFVWIAAGRVVAAKDYTNLLSAFARVHRVRGDTQLWIAGEQTDPEFDRVSRFAVALGLANVVQWLGLRRDMPALLDAADAFVMSSAWEGMPLAVAEAMAMEKPVVATDVGGVRELVGTAGAIVPSRDAEALAAAMQNLMESAPDRRLALGRAARQRISTQFCIDAKAGEWERFYRTVVEAKRDRR